MFLDEAVIYVRAGRGGHGCVSFRREKFVPKGGPDGGDGGHGGSIVLRAAEDVETLLDFAGSFQRIAENGRPGSGKNQTGRSGRDLVVDVPPGTLVYDRDSGVLVKDLTPAGAEVVAAQGGRGGFGNKHYTTSTNQAPRQADPGAPGEERWLKLVLKLIADVGLVGLPNAGKSTLLARISKARPKIADYPFTTLKPQLGIVELAGYRRFVVADLPGLIEGAHRGAGLGHEFLRHIERTRLILHMIDAVPPPGTPTPLEAYRIIRSELAQYSSVLAEKPEIVVVNKMDVTEADATLQDLRATLDLDVRGISAVTGRGVEDLMEYVWHRVQAERAAGFIPAA
ncbi:MAG TPA: GTPase ObgE [Phycisphaerae bacterium]|jgi:GTP-binding protein